MITSIRVSLMLTRASVDLGLAFLTRFSDSLSLSAIYTLPEFFLPLL